MKKISRDDKILFLGLSVFYISMMSFCVHMITPHHVCLVSVPRAPIPLSSHQATQILDDQTEALAADRDDVVADANTGSGSELVDEMGDMFDFDPDFLASVRGKEAERLFQPLIISVANTHKVDPALINSIIWAESSFNPRAISKKGAVGLMQLMPSTAESLGIEDSLNPESNINGGVRYFKKLLKKFNGDHELALAAYNAGSRKVLEYNGVPPFEATRYYIEKVFMYYEGYKKFKTNEVVDRI